MSQYVPSGQPVRNVAGQASVSGPEVKFEAWNGLTIDPVTSVVWALALGGHGDYFGNEVSKLDLQASSPAWVEVVPRSSGNTVDNTLPAGRAQAFYTDGKPASCHTYYSQQFIPSQRRALRVGANAVSQSGTSYFVCSSLDVTSGMWDGDLTFPDINGGVMGITANATCQDPDSEEIYFFYTNAWVRKLTPGRSLGGSWSANLNRTFLPDSFDEAASAYDTTRDRIFLVRPGTSLRYTFDPRSGTFTQVLLSGAGLGGFSALANKGVGMVYVPATDSYYVRGNGAGGTTYQIRADTFEVTVLPTTGGAAQPGPPAVAANNYAHVYNRWLLVPALGGIVFFPTSSTNAWFLRTH